MIDTGNVARTKREQQLDGFDHFAKLKKLMPSKRKKMVYNIDDRRDRAAVRIGDMKLLRGMWRGRHARERESVGGGRGG